MLTILIHFNGIVEDEGLRARSKIIASSCVLSDTEQSGILVDE
jgi:hypothetical protein